MLAMFHCIYCFSSLMSKAVRICALCIFIISIVSVMCIPSAFLMDGLLVTLSTSWLFHTATCRLSSRMLFV